jgi:ferrous iron transport protein B
VSMVAFGSACSYQIGASLSVFNAYGKPWWFAPYVAALFIVGAIHTRVWIGRLSGQRTLTVLSERAFLQRPSALAIWWRVRASARQFVCQAMPIFLAICVMGAVLAHVGVTAWLSAMMTPALTAIGLPAWVAPAVVFSIIRKDGLLVVNQGDGTLIRSLTDGQLFLLVFLTSTLTTCMVTAWTIRQELGMSEAVKMAGRQAVTAVLATLLLGILCE